MSPSAEHQSKPSPEVLKAYPRTQEDVDLIDEAVAKNYQTRSAFILKAATERAKEVLEDEATQ